MFALQDSFLDAFKSMTHVGDNIAPTAGSSSSEENNMVINELNQIVQTAETVINYTSWIFNLTTAALGLCALSLVCLLYKIL